MIYHVNFCPFNKEKVVLKDKYSCNAVEKAWLKLPAVYFFALSASKAAQPKPCRLKIIIYLSKLVPDLLAVG